MYKFVVNDNTFWIEFNQIGTAFFLFERQIVLHFLRLLLVKFRGEHQMRPTHQVETGR